MAPRRLASLVALLGVTLAAGGLHACTSFGEAPSPSTDEGGADGSPGDPPDGATSEGGEDGPGPPLVRCPVGAPFGAPEIVAVQGTMSIEAARFDRDGARGVVSACPDGNRPQCDLYAVTLSAAAGVTDLLPLPQLNQAGSYEAFPALDTVGHTILFASDRTNNQVSLFSAPVTVAGFGPVTALVLPTQPSQMVYASEPYVLANGKTVYFSAADENNADYDLFRATGDAPDYGIADAVLLSNVTVQEDVAPVVADDEREMFWASDRPRANGAAGKGALDIWTATRDGVGPKYRYDDERALEGLSSPGIDYPTWLSPDACDLYIIRKQSGIGKLMVAHRR